MDLDDNPSHKRHHASKVGAKAKKKTDERIKTLKEKGKGKIVDPSLEAARIRNPKAFSFSKTGKMHRQAQVAADRHHKREHLPVVDRAVEALQAPPVIVAVQGPPGVGKTTLIKCLIKHYTKQNVKELRGPVTLISGKKKRITIIEVPNDLTAMVDIAKVADLVLMCVDANYGFEMETFEFLNLLQSHGFPKVMGILTHLDLFKKQSSLRRTKNLLKKRFWTEIYEGAKMFYLSGILHGKYMKRDVTNLARYISLQKYRPLVWRNTHPYLLCDRVEDITNPEAIRQNPKCSRRVALFGYVHGTNLKKTMKVHIPGCGDFYPENMSTLPDPCPFPSEKRTKQRITSKEKVLYAPMSNVGEMLYDHDGIYINIPDHKVNFTDPSEHRGSGPAPRATEGPGEKMVREMQKMEGTIDANLDEMDFVLFGDSKNAVTLPENNGNHSESSEDEGDFESDDEGDGGDHDELDSDEGSFDGSDDSDDEAGQYVIEQPTNDTRTRRSASAFHSTKEIEEPEDLAYDDGSGSEDEDDQSRPHTQNISMDEDSQEDDDEEGSDQEHESGLRWKQNMINNALKEFHRPVDLMKIVYSAPSVTEGPQLKPKSTKKNILDSDSSGDDGDEEDELHLARSLKSKDLSNEVETSRFHIGEEDQHLDLENEDISELLLSRFLSPDAKFDAKYGVAVGKDEVYGDFEDLEAEEGDKPKPTVAGPMQIEEEEEDLDEKKKKMKEDFDTDYDKKKEKFSSGNIDDNEKFFEDMKAGLDQQKKKNQEAFAMLPLEDRIHLEGHSQGHYVRVEIDDMPYEFIEFFNPSFPIVVGGLNPQEDALGFVQVRLKKHRWHKKILKTNDPLIISVGWRRFQTQPIYSTRDHNMRNRALKYTPQHMHCIATFWGPITPPNTGIIGFQYLAGETKDFRIGMTGVVLEIAQSVEIVKKLKLIGYPYAIKKNTSFIKDMFNSTLEVNKFVGASIRTVSGIRGQIKKSQAKPEGAFRAAFEDKIKKSDIVMLRTWYPVMPPKYYNPVSDLLVPERNEWQGMKTVFQLRQERTIPVPVKNDSLYKPIKRKEFAQAPLKVPTKLLRDLPFKSIPKQKPRLEAPSLESSRAVILQPHEKERVTVLNHLSAIKNHKVRTTKEKKKEKLAAYLKDKAKEDASKSQVTKTNKRELYRLQGLMKKDREKGPPKKKQRRK